MAKNKLEFASSIVMSRRGIRVCSPQKDNKQSTNIITNIQLHTIRDLDIITNTQLHTRDSDVSLYS